MVLKVNFIDISDMKEYKAGEDVSHLSKPALDFLTKSDLIDTTTEPVKVIKGAK